MDGMIYFSEILAHGIFYNIFRQILIYILVQSVYYLNIGKLCLLCIEFIKESYSADREVKSSLLKLSYENEFIQRINGSKQFT